MDAATPSAAAGERPTRHEPVLVLAPRGRDADLACQLIERAGEAAIRCREMDDLMHRISAGSGPAVIAEEALTCQTAEELCGLLEVQPSWSDLPLIVFVNRSFASPAIQRLARRRNTTLLKRPIQIPSFLTVIRSSVQSRERQYEVRRLLRSLRQLNARLNRRASQLQRLVTELSDAEERERARLAQVLHDDLQQILVGAKFGLSAVGAVCSDCPQDTDRIVEQTRDVTQLLDQAIETARTLSHELSPSVLRQEGLVPALSWLGDVMRSRYGLQVSIEVSGAARDCGDTLRTLLFRVAQELLFNVVKHASAHEASLHLAMQPDRVRLEVRDGGCGFDPDGLTQGDDTHGLGLFSIEERIVLFGGRMEIDSEPGKGTAVRITVPASRAAATTSERPGSGELGKESPRGEPPKGKPPVGVVRSHRRAQRPVTVLLADDHRVVRQGLRALLEDYPDIDVQGEAEDGLQAYQLASETRPDVVIMDVAMPELDGIEATRRIKSQFPSIRVIGLSMFEAPESRRRMLAAGADVYLLKSDPIQELVAKVRGAFEEPRAEDPSPQAAD